MSEPDCIKLLGEHRRRESFDVACHRFVDFLSHGTVLDDCTITIRGSSRGIVFHGATLRNCRIVAQRRFANFSWHDVILQNCGFEGVFVGCDFGPRPDAYPQPPYGELTACDFTQAQVHNSRLFRSDMTQQRLPPWPCFTVLEPERNAADWLSIPFPESFRIEQATIVEAVPEKYRVEGVVAVCEDAKEIAKKHKITLEEIKRCIEGRAYIVQGP